MKKTDLKTEAMIWIIMLLPFLFYYLWRDQLPQEVNVHYNVHGEADRTMQPLNFALTMFALNVFVYLVIMAAPYMDPKKNNYARFPKFYSLLRWVMPAFLSGIVVFEYLKPLGFTGTSGKTIYVPVLLLLMFLGNYLGSVKQNWFIGIRTPWTMSNEDVWRKTHRMGGRVIFFASLAGLLCLFFFPVEWMAMLVLTIALGSALGSVVYSWICYRALQKQSK